MTPGFETAIDAVAVQETKIRKQLGEILAGMTAVAIDHQLNILRRVFEESAQIKVVEMNGPGVMILAKGTGIATIQQQDVGLGFQQGFSFFSSFPSFSFVVFFSFSGIFLC